MERALLLPCCIGVGTAALSGVAAIALVKLLTRRSGFRGFCWYLIGAGALVILLSSHI